MVRVYALCSNNPALLHSLRGLVSWHSSRLRAELMPKSNRNSTQDQAVNPSHSVSFQTELFSLSPQLSGRAVIEAEIRAGAPLQDWKRNRAVIRLQV